MEKTHCNLPPHVLELPETASTAETASIAETHWSTTSCHPLQQMRTFYCKKFVPLPKQRSVAVILRQGILFRLNISNEHLSKWRY